MRCARGGGRGPGESCPQPVLGLQGALLAEARLLFQALPPVQRLRQKVLQIGQLGAKARP